LYNVDVALGSVSPEGNKITTFIMTYPRIIHSEFMTHRVFSRNAGSSRAIPFNKMLEAATFTPIRFGGNKPGMNTTDENISSGAGIWERAKANAIESARQMHEAGVHKSICNRLIEPFTYITVIATTTELENFFNLRCHPDAEIHMQKLAYMMQDAVNRYTYVERKLHMPLGENMIASVARCARVSYNMQDKSDADDLKLYNKLKESGHWSPFEHQAHWERDVKVCRNFTGGWIQFRSTVDTK